jgi:DNA-binding NarL/FixJ family response regulator
MAENHRLEGADFEATPTRVQVVADDALVAGALRGALAQAATLVLVERLADAHVVLWDTGSHVSRQPSAADRKSQVASGASVLAPHAAGVPVLALASDEAHASALLGTRSVHGVVLRQADPARLAAALIALRHGLRVVDGALAGAVWPPASEAEVDGEDAPLTAREHEVLTLVALGLSNKTIARRLEVSIHTVKFHMNSILAKLGTESRTGAVASAVRRGLLRL